ncbi:hypothetical protein IPN41_01365 [Candidatus Falkowbacteria bacterium]|nr:MAG: hypothetical protein IPN41_01365 [Candidatus Falkowbacteria bacterium]
MNKFIFDRPELLSSINGILSPVIGNYSLVVIIGLLGVFIGVVYNLIVYFKKKKFITSNTIVYFLLILWLPLFLHFFYSNIKEIINNIIMVNRPFMEQLRWRYCQIDVIQNFEGRLCRIPLFVEFVRENVPGNSIVYIAAGAEKPFLEFQLLKDYALTSKSETADFLLLYHPLENHSLSSEGGLYRFGIDQTNSDFSAENFLGFFKEKNKLNQQMVIFENTKL